jgi:hypothetical protein
MALISNQDDTHRRLGRDRVDVVEPDEPIDGLGVLTPARVQRLRLGNSNPQPGPHGLLSGYPTHRA